MSVTRAAESGIPGATTLTSAQALSILARDLTTHFRLEGELQLELLRVWTAPARQASGWEVNVLEYPHAPTSSMLVRCRVVGDSVPVAETT
ncbi:MAG: hypothetical protein ACREH8_22090, partial [Opitutaceae bacterium]